MATHVETELEPEMADEDYVSPIPGAGYTSRHVLSIFPPMPVLDKLQELQDKLSARTRIVTVPRSSMQIVLVPLGTSLHDPGKLQEAIKVRSTVFTASIPSLRWSSKCQTIPFLMLTTFFYPRLWTRLRSKRNPSPSKLVLLVASPSGPNLVRYVLFCVKTLPKPW